MHNLILLNKPFNVLSQFTDTEGRQTLADFVTDKGFYAAGRLDYDSEGLLLLTSEGNLQHKISDPKHKMAKTYWAQVEGLLTDDALQTLTKGVQLKDGLTRPAKARLITEPELLWPRTPPIRQRANKPTSWLELTISEGKNRQVRRMTAAVGFPTLRLIRYAIGDWSIDDIDSGAHKTLKVPVPASNTQRPPRRSAKPSGRYNPAAKEHSFKRKKQS